jgi:endonuclease/exonuclease/phosphatase family metal-dependent hydrolase
MKLVTWNAQWCCGLDGVVSAKRIVDTARALADFDVLCLQEIAVNYPRLRGDASGDQPAQLRELLPGFEVLFAPAVDEWQRGQRRRFGNVIATRLPLSHVERHALPYPPDPDVISMPRVCVVATVIDPALGPVRVMTTHLEYESKAQRLAQAHALRELHAQYRDVAARPPKEQDEGSPFDTRVHAADAILCGDFNHAPHEQEHAAITRPVAAGRLWDCWTLLNGDAPHAPTFRLYDHSYGEEPVAYDFVFVSDGLKDKVRTLRIDGTTKASDHQPVAVELAEPRRRTRTIRG